MAAYHRVHDCHLWADCLGTGISSGPQRSLIQVWDYLYITFTCTRGNIDVSAPRLSDKCVISSWTPRAVTAAWEAAKGASFYIVSSSSSQANITVADNSLTFENEYVVSVTGYGPQRQRGNTVSCNQPDTGSSRLLL